MALLSFAASSRAQSQVAFKPDQAANTAGAPARQVISDVDLPPLSKNGLWFASIMGKNQNLIRIWDTRTERVAQRIRIPNTTVTAIAFSPDSRRLAAIGDMGLAIFDVESGEKLQQFAEHHSATGEMIFAPDGKSVFVSTIDSVRQVDFQTGKVRSSIPYPSTPDGIQQLCLLSLSAAGDLLASTTDSGIHVYRVADGTQVRHIAFGDPKPSYYSVLISPTGLLIATMSVDSSISLWEVNSGHEVAQIRSDFTVPNSIGFSPDSRFLAASTADSVVVFDALNGEPRIEYSLDNDEGDDFVAERVGFSSDSRQLVALIRDPERTVPRRQSWDVSALFPATKAGASPTSADDAFTAQDFAQCWDSLGSRDARLAMQAMRKLVDHPQVATSMLERQLREAETTVPSQDDLELEASLRKLDHESFAVRERAAQLLRSAGRFAEPLLNRALQNRPTYEVKQRIDRLLEELSDARRAKSYQRVRAVNALELIDSEESHRTVRWAAESTDQPEVQAEANSAAARMARKHTPKP
ncbi:MAG: hypothetical protein RIS70_3853 [Planctomycetota bacterium]